MENAYLEIVGAIGAFRHILKSHELVFIGEFTRENILAWLKTRTGPEWVGVTPVEDFHAVCGAIDIPWATEQGRRSFPASSFSTKN